MTLEQLASVWNALDPRRRIIAVVATLGVFAAILGLARMATAPGMALLYAGLEGARAGEVIQALEQRGIAYEVRGDAIYVQAPARDETRMSLAAQGLPAQSAGGYELLDGLTGFGTTAQMFDAAYWRAKEGELARTIMASPHIRHARVHIAHGAAQPFRRDHRASASVTVTPSGATLTPAQAQALRFLVAAAVAGLRPDDVAVIDSNGGTVLGDETEGTGHGGDRAEALRRNVERLLAARVGSGRAVVEVNVETVTDRETIVERLIDPEARVAVSQETEERNATSTDSRAAGVSVASNLPDGDAAPADGRAESREVSARERISWEVSQTRREVERGPGAIRRLTVAVLIDGVRGVDANGVAQWTPRPEAELEALRDLVASAVGFDPSRGDVITLRSLPFEPMPADTGTGADTGLVAALGLDVMGLIRLAALVAVALILAMFVVRPILGAPGRRTEPEALPSYTLPGLPAAGAAAAVATPALTGVIDDAPDAVPGAAPRAASEPAAPPDPVARMRQLIAERQNETLEILRHWMDEPQEPR